MANQTPYKKAYSKTRALLNLNNSIQHLHHFCDLLPSDDFIDSAPEYIYDESIQGKFTVTVVLPPSVSINFRRAKSERGWDSQIQAKRDAAFEACLQLYNGGLLNNSFLPLMTYSSGTRVYKEKIEMVTGDTNLPEQLNPWVSVASLWSDKKNLVRYIVNVESDGSNIISMEMILPACLKDIKPMTLYWDATRIVKVTISKIPGPSIVTDTDTQKGHTHTLAILESAYQYRFPIETTGFAAIFLAEPSVESSVLTAPARRVTSETFRDPLKCESLVLRNTRDHNRPMLFHKCLPDKPAESDIRNAHWDYRSFPQHVPYLALRPISKRADFLHPVPPENEVAASNKAYDYALPTSYCTKDNVTFNFILFALFMPSILHRVQVYMVANTLATTILRDVEFKNIQLVVTAITTSNAREEENYQRLEFLGDSVLKFCTAVQLMKDNMSWHEGYLSSQKDRLVCNARLARAANETGLHRFVLKNSFTGDKWRPLYISKLLQAGESSGTRKISFKVLADVVEALLGAAMVDGGLDKVVKCLRVFVPEGKWMPLKVNREALFNSLIPTTVLTPLLQPLEDLIGYKFQNKTLLIEAMAHGTNTTANRSYDRLEFLGDAILDHIIVNKIFGCGKEIGVPRMHLMRTTLVNADFLAFMCMQFTYRREVKDAVKDQRPGGKETIISIVERGLWSFMSFSSKNIGESQTATTNRHAEAQSGLVNAILQGNHHPWTQLARLQAPKFFSDIVESLLGAMWVDSGSLEVCESLLEKMLILPYLRRIIDDDVHLWHPKEELDKLAPHNLRWFVNPSKEKPGKTVCTVFLVDKETMIGRSEGDTTAGCEEWLKLAAAEEAIKTIKRERGL